MSMDTRRANVSLPYPARATETVPHSGGAADDYVLLQRVAERDRQAFEQLYQRYARRLLGYITRRLPQRELAEEVLNDVMLALWQQAPKFDPRGSVASWLFRIALHKVCSAIRYTRARPLPPPAPLPWDDAADPEGGLAHQELRGAVVQAIANLPAGQREVVELTYYHDFSYQEIATIVGCPVNTVKTRMARARRCLAPLLAAMDLGTVSGQT